MDIAEESSRTGKGSHHGRFMLVQQAYRYELKPNNVQRTMLAMHAGTARFAWNWALARRIERFAANEGPQRFSDAIKDHRAWNVWKKEHAPWTCEVSKCAAQEAFRDLDRAFANFRRGRAAGRKVGFPKFKRKGVHDSCRFSTGAIRALGRSVQLPRLGMIRVKEPTRVKGRILSATVCREADRWFVSFAVERERPDHGPVGGPTVGIDLGVNCFAVLSDGERIQSPRPLAHSLRRLRRLSRQHSRKERGSCNRRRSAVRLARLHRRIRNRRRDFLHKVTTRLSKTKGVIVIEDLCIGGLTRSARGTPQRPGRGIRAKSGLNRAIQDQGWGEFGRMLAYKTKWYGSELRTAPSFYPSSRICSACGILLESLPQSVRSWTCPGCGVGHDRDLNAAINLQAFATGSSPGSDACGDPSGGGTDLVRSTSHGSPKQEANPGLCPSRIDG